MAEKEFGAIQTADPEMKRILKLAENVAASKATVLIHGESGTGKELLARFIHAKSQRAGRRLVAVNCAAVPDGLLESELFGYEKGAFTGANGSKPGKFELANESTFLLDEISELPLLLQAKLLRVIQEGEIERLGARQPLKVNVRLVATTNRDLSQMVKAGQFREDLFYRLNVLPLRVPPLSRRPKDIELLARFFVEVSGELNGRRARAFSDEAMHKLLSWSWPGNVRELENVIERSVLLAEGDTIQSEEILINGFNDAFCAPAGDALEGTTQATTPLSTDAFLQLSISPGMTLGEAERQLILKTLEYTRQNRTQAAKLLGISIRTLRNKLHEYNAAKGPSGESLMMEAE
ncbi:MAG: sigma-54 dependent transcriptional regulator [Bdellovibrionaceae bacterium]|nr:sigma-54 dependent transcriptional regulator [Pseudobdellovibrionaceae bacterium]